MRRWGLRQRNARWNIFYRRKAEQEIGTLLCDFLRKENYRVSLADTGGKGIIDIPENDEEHEWLAKQNFKNSVDDAYTGG